MDYLSYIGHFIPRMAFISLSILPSIVFLLLGERNRRKTENALFVNHVIAATVGAVLPLLSILEFVFGHGGNGQAGLIFLFLPFYASVCGIVSYLIGRAVIRRRVSARAGNPYPLLLLIPGLLVLCNLTVSAVLTNREVYLHIAENSTSLAELQFLYEKARKADDHGIFLFLAQNPATSPDILEKMSSLPFLNVKVFIARHKNTPTSTLIRLQEDEEQGLRRCAIEELNRRKQNGPGNLQMR
jgi:hypothetical protein